VRLLIKIFSGARPFQLLATPICFLVALYDPSLGSVDYELLS
jgi:hypothetical protein